MCSWPGNDGRVIESRAMTNPQFVPRTVCAKGHTFTPENTYRTSNGRKRCRTCYKAYKRETQAVTTQAARTLGIKRATYIARYGYSVGLARRVIDGWNIGHIDEDEV